MPFSGRNKVQLEHLNASAKSSGIYPQFMFEFSLREIELSKSLDTSK